MILSSPSHPRGRTHDDPATHSLGAVRRLATLTLVVLLGLSGATMLADPAAAQERPGQATAAATWLAGQLEDGAMPGFSPDQPDWGLTLDALFALAAARAPQETVTEVADAVEDHVADYATYDTFGLPGFTVAGAMAKELVAAQVVGRDPKAFGGYDLVARTRAMVAANGSVHDLEDTGVGATANLFGQSLAMIGLARADALPAETVPYLVSQQCRAGYFLIFPEDGKNCDQADGAPDRDATALAVMALLAAQNSGLSGTEASLTKARAWLVADQATDGSFRGGVGTDLANANSTGLAAAALAGLGVDGAAERAGAWMVGLQLTKANGKAAAAEAGAIAYSPDSLADAQTDGVGLAADQFRRSTSQAVFAFVPVGLQDLVYDPPSPPSPSPSPSPTPTPTPVSTATPTPTPIPSTPSSSPTPTPSPSSRSPRPSASSSSPGEVEGTSVTVAPTSSAAAPRDQIPPTVGDIADTGSQAGPGLIVLALMTVVAGGTLVARRRR